MGLPGFKALAMVCGLGAVSLPLSARDLITPAELPPPEFRGQQYVDSKGCLFMRAGQAGKTLWIPRVSRLGVPQCGNAPSGRRVPIAGEGAADTAAGAVTEKPAPDQPAVTAGSPLAQGSFLVAVGSFGVAENADKAAARLKVFGYPVARARLQGGSGGLVTVFAGPFETAERAAKVQSELRGAGFPDAIIFAP